MIKHITKISNVRSFLDFNCSDLEFKRKNILYAPNGTGKTNLSRLFKFISKGGNISELLSIEAEGDISKLKFNFTFETTHISESNYSSHADVLNKIIVFNSDYIDATIKTNDFSKTDVSGDVIIPVGELSSNIIEIKKNIAELEKSLKEKKSHLKEKFSKNIEDILKEKVYTKKDKNIWKELDFSLLIDENNTVYPPENLPEFRDCEEDFKKLTKIDSENLLDPDKIRLIDFDDAAFTKFEDELKNSKNFQLFENEIKDKIEEVTKDWIEAELFHQGIKKSEDKNVCILCDRALDGNVESLFSKYDQYFKNEESTFKKYLNDFSKYLMQIRSAIEKLNNDLENDTNEFCNLFKIERKWLKIDNTDLLNLISRLVEFIKEKKKYPDRSLEISTISDGLNITKELHTLNSKLQNNLKTVEKVNNKILNQEVLKANLRTLIGKKLLFQFYEKNEQKFDDFNKDKNSLGGFFNKEREELKKLPQAGVSKNIEKVCNDFLHNYLQLNKYSFREENGLIFLNLNKKIYLITLRS